jgi:hypothetical protein
LGISVCPSAENEGIEMNRENYSKSLEAHLAQRNDLERMIGVLRRELEQSERMKNAWILIASIFIGITFILIVT